MNADNGGKEGKRSDREPQMNAESSAEGYGPQADGRRYGNDGSEGRGRDNGERLYLAKSAKDGGRNDEGSRISKT